MTKYWIKNYRRNLLESVRNFQKKYPSMKIVETIEEKDFLKITIESSSNSKMGTFM